MNEQEITRRLRDAADIAPSATSPFEMTVSAPRPGRPIRWVPPALAGLLLAAGVGFAAGQSRSGGEDNGSPATTIPSVTETTPAPTSTVATPTTDQPVPIGTVADDVVEPDGPGGFSGVPPFTRVLERTVGDVRIQVSETEPWTGTDFDPTELEGFEDFEGFPSESGPRDGFGFEADEFRMPDACFTSIQTRIAVDGPTIVDVSESGYEVGLTSDPTYQTAIVGAADGSPYLLGYVLSGDADVVSVSMSAGGSSDTTEPTDGRAVLLLPLSAEMADGQVYANGAVELTATMADGTTTPVAYLSDLVNEICYPTPMPAPGAQPADPDGAFAEVADSFDRLMDPDVVPEEKSELLNDWTGVVDALNAAQNGKDAELFGELSYTIDDHVFTSPTEVWFKYTIRSAVGDAPDMYGFASLVDGTWQFRREMVCDSVIIRGAECVPASDPIGPYSMM